MPRLFHQRHLDILASQRLGSRRRRLPWHLMVLHAVKEMHRAGDVQPAAKPQIVATVGDQVPGIFHRLVGIGVGKGDDTVGLDAAALLVGEFRPEKVLGEIGRGGNADQSGDAVRSRQCHIQHQPAAKRGPDQNLRPFGQRIQRGQAVGCPARDIAVEKIAARQAVAAIIEPQAWPAGLLRPFLDHQRLGAVHVRAMAAQEGHAGSLAGPPAVGQPFAAANIEIVCLIHARHPLPLILCREKSSRISC